MTSIESSTRIDIEYVLTKGSEDSCECSVKHIPNPLRLAKIQVNEKEQYILCPSGLFNLQDLLWQYHLTDGTPEGSITKHYGKYVRDLAAKIYFMKEG